MGRTALEDASLSQQKTLAIFPKVTAALSVISSIYIIVDVARLQRSKQKTYHRLLLGLSIFNCMACTACFFTTWPIPPEVLPIWGAKGTQQTCTAQGFFVQMLVGTAIYYGSLGLYYYLVIKKGWTERQLERSRVEWGIHTTAVIFSLGTAVVALSMDLFNPIGWFCWIGSTPINCDDEGDCIRGENAGSFRLAFLYVPMWVMLGLDTIMMAAICLKFWKQEHRNLRWKQHTEKERKNTFAVSAFATSSRLRSICYQSLLYLFIFYLSNIFAAVLRVAELVQGTVWYHWMVLTATFVSANGFLVLLVYLRPRFVAVHERRKRQRRLAARQNNKIPNPENRVAVIKEEEEIESDTSLAIQAADEEHSQSTKPPIPGKGRSRPLLETLNELKKTILMGDGGLGGDGVSEPTTAATLRRSEEFSELPILEAQKQPQISNLAAEK